jgi:hypothetical protein
MAMPENKMRQKSPLQARPAFDADFPALHPGPGSVLDVWIGYRPQIGFGPGQP